MIPTPVYFIIGMAILAVWDWKWYELPNLLILPLIAVSVAITGNWQWALIMFGIGAGLFGFKWQCPACGHTESHQHVFSLHRGGDVKLFALIGALAGLKALWICAFGYLLLFAYRQFKYQFAEGLPLTPFLFLPFAVLIWFK